MADLRRRRGDKGRSIAARLRHLVYLFWALLLLVSVTAVGALQIQTNEVNRLTLAIGPATVANAAIVRA